VTNLLWQHAVKVLRAIGIFFLLWPFLPPILRAFGFHSLPQALEYPWTLTCHRFADRTIDLLGHAMPMCSRCAGISIGIGLGLIAGKPYYGPKFMWGWIVVATGLMFADIYTLSADPHHVWHPSRLATGALLALPVAAAVSAIARREAAKGAV
jgi:hypothetical protein